MTYPSGIFGRSGSSILTFKPVFSSHESSGAYAAAVAAFANVSSEFWSLAEGISGVRVWSIADLALAALMTILIEMSLIYFNHVARHD